MRTQARCDVLHTGVRSAEATPSSRRSSLCFPIMHKFLRHQTYFSRNVLGKSADRTLGKSADVFCSCLVHTRGARPSARLLGEQETGKADELANHGTEPGPSLGPLDQVGQVSHCHEHQHRVLATHTGKRLSPQQPPLNC